MAQPQLPQPVQHELWSRWKGGENLGAIARALELPRGSIHHVLVLRGGIAPLPRRRAARSLGPEEREEISRGLAAGLPIRRIAQGLRRCASTISREVARNNGSALYRAAEADSRAWESARRPKACRLATCAKLRSIVSEKLELDWSPEQISAWLKRQFPDDDEMRVSHETIYRSLFVQARGALKKELIGHLRIAKRVRRPKAVLSNGAAQGRIIDAVSIRERPAEAEDRAIPGHWEGDLLVGNKQTQIATLVERHTRFTMLIKLGGKDTHGVVSALSKHVRKLPRELRRSLTWDRGLEMAAHKEFTIATDVRVYFCDPRSPWQRGSNENTNGLLRQYFPKGTDLSVHSQAHLDKIALRLNQRPRKTLGFETPADRLAAVLR
jgi:transposase, IS30 family